MSDSTFLSQASPSGQETMLRVQSQPLPSLLEPWTSAVEQNTVQHHYFRDEETEALARPRPELEPWHWGLQALRLMLFYFFLVRVTPSAAKSFTPPHPQQGLVSIRCGKHRGPTSPCPPLNSSLPHWEFPWYFIPTCVTGWGTSLFSSPEFFLHINWWWQWRGKTKTRLKVKVA